MERIRDRRGHRRLHPRRQRRASWLDRDLRARRRRLLRTRWRDLAVIVGAFTVSAALLATAVHRWPLLVGLVAGVYLGTVAVSLLVLLAVADGSLLARMGRSFENYVGDELRSTPGVFGVVSGVSFAHRDLDHVVLAPKGCFAVEVKASFSRRTALNEVPGLAGKLAQARDGAAQVRRLLASRGMPLPVTPVLVLAGPGAPIMTAVQRHHDVLVVAFADSDAWGLQMAGPATRSTRPPPTEPPHSCRPTAHSGSPTNSPTPGRRTSPGSQRSRTRAQLSRPARGSLLGRACARAMNEVGNLLILPVWSVNRPNRSLAQPFGG